MAVRIWSIAGLIMMSHPAAAVPRRIGVAGASAYMIGAAALDLRHNMREACMTHRRKPVTVEQQNCRNLEQCCTMPQMSEPVPTHRWEPL